MAIKKDPQFDKTDCAHVCKDCIKFDAFGKSCWVYWDNKKYCSMKVADQDDWDQEKKILA